MQALGSATDIRSADASAVPDGAMPVRKLVFSYQRVSTSRQGKEGRSGLRRQQKAFEEWLKNHPEYVAADLTFSETTTGRVKHRTKGTLSKLLKILKKGRTLQGQIIPEGSCVYVEAFSRLTRDQPDDAIELCLEIFRSGYRLVFGQWSPEVLNSKSHRVWSKIIDAAEASSYEFEDKCARMQEVCDDKLDNLRNGDLSHYKARGERSQTDYPFWLDFDEENQKFVFVEHHAEWLRKAFEMVKTQSVKGVAEALAVPSIKDSSKLMSANVIERYLKNPEVIGWKYPTRQGEPTGEKFRIYPQLVSEADFSEACEAMKNRRTNNGKNKSPKMRNLFGKRTYCANCGSVVGVKPSPNRKGGQYYYLKCNANERDKNVCTSRKLAYNENHLINLLGEFHWEEYFSDGKQEADIEEARNEVLITEGRLNKIKDQIDNLNSEVVKRVKDGKTGPVLDALENELQKLKPELDSALLMHTSASNHLTQLRSMPTSESISSDIRSRINSMMKSDLTDYQERVEINSYLHDMGICIAVDLDKNVFDVGIGKVVNRQLIELDQRATDLIGLGISPSAVKDVMRSVNDPNSTGAVVINGKRHTTAQVKG